MNLTIMADYLLNGEKLRRVLLMSLFNNLFGFSNEAEFLLNVLNLKEGDIPRFRDCFYDCERNQIVIHTRTGGGNREYYDNEESCRDNYPEYFESGDVPCGPWNSDLVNHPLYLTDYDDDYDCTYANFVFKAPDEHIDTLKEIFSGKETITPSDKWKLLFNKMDEMKNDNQ